MIAETIEKGTKFSPANIPVGNALGLIAGVGLGGGLNEIVKSFLPVEMRRLGGVGTGLGIAWLVQNLPFFRKILGTAGVDALAIGVLFHAIESTFFLQGRISSAVSGVVLSRRTVATARPTQTATPTVAETERAEPKFQSSVNNKLRAILEVA